jgi:hypothetical protein
MDRSIRRANRRLLVAGILGIIAWLSACSCVIPARAATYPGFIDMVTDSALVITTPRSPKPSYLTPVTEPTFRTKVTRITGDSGRSMPLGSRAGRWGRDSRHHYSKDQPWNSDNTLIAIQNPSSAGGSPTRLLLDGETYRPLSGRCEYRLDDFRWHPSPAYPRVQIGVREARDSLVWFDPIDCKRIRGWKLPFTPKGIGQGEGNPSHDGRFIAIANSKSIVVIDMEPKLPYASYASGNRRLGPVYTISPCSLVTTSPNECGIGNISISPSGKYVDVKFSGPTAAHRIFAVDPITLALKPHNMAQSSLRCGSFQNRPNGWIFPLKHADMALNPFDRNEDVIVGARGCTGSSLGRVVMVRLRDGAVTELTNPKREASVRHVSARNLDRPGWAYVGYDPVAGKRFSGEIIAVKLDGSKACQRFAHHRSDRTDCYRCEPHAVPSRDGRRVLWASNWAHGCSTCGAPREVKSYVVDARAAVRK